MKPKRVFQAIAAVLMITFFITMLLRCSSEGADDAVDTGTEESDGTTEEDSDTSDTETDSESDSVSDSETDELFFEANIGGSSLKFDSSVNIK